MEKYNSSIILIGPMGVGKTSVAKIVAEKLNKKYIDIDELRGSYYIKMKGFDMEELMSLTDEAWYNYMKPFEAQMVKLVLDEFEDAVFDFGAGHSVYKDDEHIASVEKSLKPYKNVIFLRYSLDDQESLNVLDKRHSDVPDEMKPFLRRLNEYMIKSKCNEKFAKYIIDTKSLSIEETAERVINIYGIKKNLWNEYQKGTEIQSPYITATEAIKNFGDFIGIALDIGCGRGRDSLYFAQNGWKTIAIDVETELIEEEKAKLPIEIQKNLEIKNLNFLDSEFSKADLVNASFNIPFCLPNEFDKVWNKIVSSLNQNGRLSVILFGEKDDWYGSETKTFANKETIDYLFKDMKIEYFNDKEYDGKAMGLDGKPVNKHWHIYEIVARKN